MLPAISVWLLLALFGSVSGTVLDLGLTSEWGNSPFLVQLVEAVAGHNDALYLPVVKSVFQESDAAIDDWESEIDAFGDDDDADIEVSRLSDEDAYRRALGGLSPIDTGFINLNLVNKIYTPRIEAHHTHYRQYVEPELAQKVHKKCATDTFGEPLENPLGAWVKYGDAVYCSESDLYALQLSKDVETAHDFDHVVGNSGPLLVLYGHPDCSRFAGMFRTLLQFAEAGNLRFAWRYVPGLESAGFLNGYGVSLTGKEKIVQSLSKGKPLGNIHKFLSKTKSSSQNLIQIPDERLHELSLKLVSYILQEDNSERFELLKTILNDLPVYAPHFLELKNPPNYVQVKQSAEKNENLGAGSDTVGVFINGAMTHKLETDLPTLIKKLEREVALVEEMVSYGFNIEQAKLLFSKFALLSAYKESEFKNGASENRFAIYQDVFVPHDKDLGAVVFFNDIERDQTYNLYSYDRKEAYLDNASQLRIGQIPGLRENVHDIIFALNFANKNQLKVFFTLSKVILDRGLGQQLGVLPVIGNERDALIADLFYHIMEAGEPTEALALLFKYYDAQPGDEDDLLAKVEIPKEKLGLYGQYNRTLEKYSIGEASVIINGVIHNMRSSNWQAAMGNQITHDVRFLQQKIRSGEDKNRHLKDVLYENAKQFRNTKVIPLDPANIRYKKISPEMVKMAHTFKLSAHSDGISATFWLIGDFDSDEILAQFASLLQVLKSHRPIQIKVLNTSKKSSLLDLLVDTFGGKSLSRLMINEIISRVEEYSPSLNQEKNPEVLALLERNHIQAHLPSMLFNSRYLRLTSLFTPDDIDLLMSYEFSQRLGIFNEITDAYPDPFAWKPVMKFKNDDTMSDLDWFDLVSSTVSDSFFLDESKLLSDVSRFDFTALSYDNAIDLTGYDKNKPIDLLAVVDPLDPISQKLLSLLTSLADLPFVNARILLLPIQEPAESKLDRIYGHSFVPSTPKFDAAGAFIQPHGVTFENLPKDVHFSAELDTPFNWYAVKGQNSDTVDLTNLQVSRDTEAQFRLARLVVEVYAKDVATAQSIPGLTLQADNGSQQVEGYTLLNLGYSQFLLSPGEWQLLLKAGSSSGDYYELLSASDNRYEVNDEKLDSVPLRIHSLMPSVINPRIRGNAQYPEQNAFSQPLTARKKTNAAINVFSIASGHTYEHLMSIMMLSVKKHTDQRVKFWLVENFLSSRFTQQLPTLATKYGFDYELIRYQWPLWLRKQTELTRTVWSYKMLFLDALFPEDLDKVIFVDADQIARADLSELAQIDLEGAPYGFPPMCDSREDMEGFRFWKHGYWQKVLQDDLKYHISALYVVDLEQFRKNLVGDRLRTHYQKLSSDPNSLLNLDQDLPNNLQRQVPIYTLPQEWLWCETWCSQEEKKTAKMIDLCNDPTSLEGKIERARRLIPEWEGYNGELQNMGRANEGHYHDEL